MYDDSDEGMGLSDFLNDSLGSRSGGWLKNWKEKGETTVFLHTRGKVIVPVFTHTFPAMEEFKDRETNKTELRLRWNRYVSPESPKDLAKDLRFRDRTTDQLQMLPTLDHLLILREWLRVMVKKEVIGPDIVVFEWEDRKNDKMVRWKAKHLADLAERQRHEWGHTLGATWEWLIAVVDAFNPGAGPQMTREKYALGEALRKCIQQEMESKGADEGNPQKNPYAIKWKYNKNAKKAADYYSAFRNDQAKYTDEIADQIIDADPPNLVEHSTPRDGDAVRLRASIEAAQLIDLPLDALFSEDVNERRAVVTGRIRAGSGMRPTSSSAPASRAGGGAPPAVPASTGGAVRRPGQGANGGGTTQAQPQTEAAPPAQPNVGRRRKVSESKPAEPPPPPPVEMIPCDDCGTPMPANASKCENCGAEYAVDDEPAQVQAAPAQSQPQRPESGATRPEQGPARPAPSSGASRPSAGGAARPSASQEMDPADRRFQDSLGSPAPKECTFCAKGTIFNGACSACGQPDEEDDIPF